MFIHSQQASLRLQGSIHRFLDIKAVRILDKQAWPMHNARAVFLFFQMLAVHASTKLAYNVKLRVVEHFAELLELVFGVVLGHLSVLLVDHVLEGIEVCAVFY
jgi:hypothetical protein